MTNQERKRKVSEAIKLLELLEDGEISAILKNSRPNYLQDELSKKVKSVAKKISQYLDVLNGLAEGDFKRRLPSFTNQDQIGSCVADVMESVTSTAKIASDVKMALESEKNKLIQEDWGKSQYTKIFSKIQGVKTLADLGNIVLSEIAYAINAQIGTFYVKLSAGDNEISHDELTLIATFGVSFENKKMIFKVGEGIIGQCAHDLRPRYIDKITNDFIQIESGLGKTPPSCVVIMPIVYENVLYGVIELGSLEVFSEIQKRLLEQVANSVGISIKSISGNMLTEKLLEEIAKKNNTLASQKLALDYSAIVAETDLKGKITYVNDKFLEISKYDRSELLGQDHRILNSKHHPKEFFLNLWKTIVKGEVWHGEVKNKAKDGTSYWVDTTIYPVKDEHGKWHKFVAIRFDITDKKRALEELQLATEQAKTAAKVKTEFLANMSHEIRTPMNAIIGMCELLKETTLNIDQERYVNILNNSGGALLDVINNILDLSKIESGHLEMEQVPYDLEDLVYSVTDIMGRSAHRKGLELIASFEPGIPIHLIGDPSRLRQVIINLLGNSIKFTQKGEITIRIENSKDKKGFLKISVTDTGIGISVNKLDKLFQNFSQANTSITREYGGTGLGLAISKKIIEIMGGSICVESKEGIGSKFYFSIPYHLQDFTPEAPIMPSQLKGMKALIVDDNATNRLVLREMLASWEIITEEATDGISALEILKKARQLENPFRLVILDYHMPHMNGVDVAKKISESSLGHPITIVMLTSEDKRGELGRARANGITSYVIKPIRSTELLQIILNSINQSSLVPTVLIVEDEEDIRKNMQDLIQTLQVNVLAASCGKEALEFIENNEVHIVISDLKMPEMSGRQLLENVRKLGKNTPFIFISGHLPRYNTKVMANFGEVDFFDKPCKESALLDILEQRLEQLKIKKERRIRANNKALEHITPQRFLIVDDVKDNSDLIQLYLKDYPYLLDFATNGEEAIEKFTKNKYDIIFMDIQMPILDGHEAIRRIRKIELEKKSERTTILALSAHALNEEMQNSLNAGADDYLVKPIKKAPLLFSIQKHTNERNKVLQNGHSQVA